MRDYFNVILLRQSGCGHNIAVCATHYGRRKFTQSWLSLSLIEDNRANFRQHSSISLIRVRALSLSVPFAFHWFNWIGENWAWRHELEADVIVHFHAFCWSDQWTDILLTPDTPSAHLNSTRIAVDELGKSKTKIRARFEWVACVVRRHFVFYHLSNVCLWRLMLVQTLWWT